MGRFFGSRWPPMDPAAFAALTGSVPLPSPGTNGAVYCVNPVLYASLPPHMMQPAPTAAEAEAARMWHQKQAEEENAAIQLVHLLVTCAGAVQAGDYSVAHGSLSDARSILASAVPTGTGIGRVAVHFAAALSQRLFPAHPDLAPPPAPSARPAELHWRFFNAGPHLKFAYGTANLAILDASEGFDGVHVVDLAVMQGLQWAHLISALARREGGPPYLRVTGIGAPATGAHDELREVGLRLAQLARSLNVPFSFRGVLADQLDELRPWMLNIVPGEALVVNSVLQLHRLLVDPDAEPAVAAPIDTLLEWVVGARPRVVTVVEQEADHNRASLVDRFTNALFHYAAVFDSLEDGCGGGAALAEAYLGAEILDVVCNEGSARGERHEVVASWRERFARAGLAQLPFGPRALDEATAHLLLLTSAWSGYGVLECDGSLALGWHDRPLYSVTAWQPTAGGGEVAGPPVNGGTQQW
jgi:DELLA protein